MSVPVSVPMRSPYSATDPSFLHPNDIRAAFARAMSSMYCHEVPAYGTLVDIVKRVNAHCLQANAVKEKEDTDRLCEERHGAIRLGTAAELHMMRRIFAVMGMHPVGYYDLSVASVPVHSTAFRPLERADLAANPFRIFTSLLRLELIADAGLRQKATDLLSKRKIFTPGAITLTLQAEQRGGLNHADAQQFIAEILETFRWHPEAQVSQETFEALITAHRLTADVVSFKGPHINHLTPRTLDIDLAQKAMIERGLPAKATIEGSPKRQCPILLRQTSFKALEEVISFRKNDGSPSKGTHTARFGEIEQRGAALTPKGRALYDRLLAETQANVSPRPDGSNANDYQQALEETFQAFPDCYKEMHDQGLAYFRYTHFDKSARSSQLCGASLRSLIHQDIVTLTPIIYEDFLPVSAAGIFQSNLGDEARYNGQSASNKAEFENALGAKTINEFDLYSQIQRDTLGAFIATPYDESPKGNP